MSRLILVSILLFTAQLQSSPTASNLFLVGSVELGKISYQLSLETEFKAEKAHRVVYKGIARLQSEEKAVQLKPVTLSVTKSSKPKVIISILLAGEAPSISNSRTEGLFLEIVAERTLLNASVGDLLDASANVMWMINSPYRDISETTFIKRDSGEASLEVLEIN